MLMCTWTSRLFRPLAIAWQQAYRLIFVNDDTIVILRFQLSFFFPTYSPCSRVLEFPASFTSNYLTTSFPYLHRGPTYSPCSRVLEFPASFTSNYLTTSFPYLHRGPSVASVRQDMQGVGCLPSQWSAFSCWIGAPAVYHTIQSRLIPIL